jgi:hypothetical protein
MYGIEHYFIDALDSGRQISIYTREFSGRQVSPAVFLFGAIHA